MSAPLLLSPSVTQHTLTFLTLVQRPPAPCLDSPLPSLLHYSHNALAVQHPGSSVFVTISYKVSPYKSQMMSRQNKEAYPGRDCMSTGQGTEGTREDGHSLGAKAWS